MQQKTTITLAYADDHTGIRQGLCMLLELTGRFKVLMQANDGQQMLDRLMKAKVLPDICIIDVAMPVMDGYELLAHIKRNWPEMHTLIFSMFVDDYAVHTLIKRGANGYLAKNSTVDELADALSGIHSNGYYYSDVADGEIFEMVHNNQLRLKELNDLELRFLTYSASQLSNMEIAEEMGIGYRKLTGIRDRLYQKLKVNSRTGLVLVGVHNGLIPIT